MKNTNTKTKSVHSLIAGDILRESYFNDDDDSLTRQGKNMQYQLFLVTKTTAKGVYALKVVEGRNGLTILPTIPSHGKTHRQISEDGKSMFPIYHKALSDESILGSGWNQPAVKVNHVEIE